MAQPITMTNKLTMTPCRTRKTRKVAGYSPLRRKSRNLVSINILVQVAGFAAQQRKSRSFAHFAGFSNSRKSRKKSRCAAKSVQSGAPMDFLGGQSLFYFFLGFIMKQQQQKTRDIIQRKKSTRHLIKLNNTQNKEQI